jgi:hypothetical protein
MFGTPFTTLSTLNTGGEEELEGVADEVVEEEEELEGVADEVVEDVILGLVDRLKYG